MTIATLKKSIKDCDVEVHVSADTAFGSRYFHASVVLRALPREPGERGETILGVQLQANDLFFPGEHDLEQPIPRQFAHMEGVGAFYAAQIETKVELFPTRDGEAAKAVDFAKLIDKTVETYNLRYLHPDCQLSRLLSALEKLGARIYNYGPGFQVCGRERDEFNRERMNSRPEGYGKRASN